MRKIVTFGEVLMRLSPPGSSKLRQVSSLDYYFGGTEMNVSAGLALMGLPACHITCLPQDMIGDAALAAMRSYGIDASGVIRSNHPIGLYFYEAGSEFRSGTISYNRQHSAFSKIEPTAVDWDTILKDAAIFHWTGITPAISEGTYKTLLEGLKVARKKNIMVTADPVFRKNLWNYGRDSKEVISELLRYTTVFIGGPAEINEILHTSVPADKDSFISASQELMLAYPDITMVVDKVRVGSDAAAQKIYARCWTNSQYLQTDAISINTITDRIGTGDAFAAGLLYILHKGGDTYEALQFAIASCVIKHGIAGDVNLATADEITALATGDFIGRINR
jgi:2-dehydro-3-deoxygluconokinase